jgi:hypothetical protein
LFVMIVSPGADENDMDLKTLTETKLDQPTARCILIGTQIGSKGPERAPAVRDEEAAPCAAISFGMLVLSGLRL